MAIELLLQLLFFILAGFLAGIIAGLIPALHVNNIAAISLIFALNESLEIKLFVSVFIASMSLTSSFIDFIPTVLFFIPSESSFASLLPSQRLFLQGKALQAIFLAASGCLAAGLVSVILSQFLIDFF